MTWNMCYPAQTNQKSCQSNISKNTTYNMKQAFTKTCILKIGKLKVKEKKEWVLEDVMNLSKPKI